MATCWFLFIKKAVRWYRHDNVHSHKLTNETRVASPLTNQQLHLLFFFTSWLRSELTGLRRLPRRGVIGWQRRQRGEASFWPTSSGQPVDSPLQSTGCCTASSPNSKSNTEHLWHFMRVRIPEERNKQQGDLFPGSCCTLYAAICRLKNKDVVAQISPNLTSIFPQGSTPDVHHKNRNRLAAARGT